MFHEASLVPDFGKVFTMQSCVATDRLRRKREGVYSTFCAAGPPPAVFQT